MRHGVFRDAHPRLHLTLPGQPQPLNIQFIVDTGFDGAFALPEAIARQVDAQFAGSRFRLLADGSLVQFQRFEIPWVDDGEEERIIEILVMEGAPLVGTQFLMDCSLYVELMDGGEVHIEPL